ncbi:hypothetical protein [Actinomadura sp. CNU-125]|uniref:hypothetical protein n=1 Tax=Actinomadura sp. CNU-125 TaxID=1904961 RepID=UPI0011778CE6|nr:hypothetical protein [Actinomadura sp. CNU-125]
MSAAVEDEPRDLFARWDVRWTTITVRRSSARNDTVYGLSGYLSGDADRARARFEEFLETKAVLGYGD